MHIIKQAPSYIPRWFLELVEVIHEDDQFTVCFKKMANEEIVGGEFGVQSSGSSGISGLDTNFLTY